MDQRWVEYVKPTGWAFMLRQLEMDLDADSNGEWSSIRRGYVAGRLPIVLGRQIVAGFAINLD